MICYRHIDLLIDCRRTLNETAKIFFNSGRNSAYNGRTIAPITVGAGWKSISAAPPWRV